MSAGNLSPEEWADIDAGIRDVAAFLRRKGFATTMSCQAGEGHTFPLPMVILDPSDGLTVEETRAAVARSLLAGGYRDFSTETTHYHGDTGRSVKYQDQDGKTSRMWPAAEFGTPQIKVEFQVDGAPVRPHTRRRAGGR